MNWAHYAILDLQQGKTTTVTPHGNSMTGRVESGDKVVLEPPPDKLAVSDIVLCKVKGNVYLHLVMAIRQRGENTQYLIGNNRGGTNGWVSRAAIYGIAVNVAGVDIR